MTDEERECGSSTSSAPRQQDARWFQRDCLERQMPRVLRGAVPELEMVSDTVVEAMVIQLLDGATSDQRSAMYELVVERMHRAATHDHPDEACSAMKR